MPTPEYSSASRPARDHVSVTVGVDRKVDGASDAFSVDLPLKPDRRPEIVRRFVSLEAGKSVPLPGLDVTPRPGTLSRSILITSEPALLRMAAGLDYLFTYPYGCTEQRISSARSYIAAKQFRGLLEENPDDNGPLSEQAVIETLQFLETVVGDDGLVSFWPGSKGYVPLTAWVVQFMVEAREAGFSVDETLLAKLTQTLKQALRSDFEGAGGQYQFESRVWALAALASVGQGDPAYGAELARRAQYLNHEPLSQVTWALSRSEDTTSDAMQSLYGRLWDGVAFKERDSQLVYAGLQGSGQPRGAQIFPSETRTLSEMMRALSTEQNSDPRLRPLLDAIVRLGTENGWGSTNANAAAMMALSEYLSQPKEAVTGAVSLKFDGETRNVSFGEDGLLARINIATPGPIEMRSEIGHLSARIVESYVPLEPGSKVAAQSNGFAVTRAMLRVMPDGPAVKIQIDEAGREFQFSVGDVIEERISVVNSKDRTQVAVVIPLAAGVEPLNPALETAPPEAKPDGQITLEPSYVAYLDDQVAFYYDELPKGNYQFAFRTKASVPGQFTQPAAYAEMMYDQAINGRSNAARIVIGKKSDDPDQAKP